MNVTELARQLKNIKPFPNMPPEVFLVLKELVPLVAVELFVVKDNKSFALLKRTGQFKGWAMPGGYLGLNESFDQACQRIARKELGINLKAIEFVDIFNWPEGSQRQAKGHAVSLLFRCRAESDSKTAQYFSLMPEGVLKHHVLMLDKVLI